MSKRFDNKKLLFVAGGLILILLITILVRAPRENATLKTKLVEFDTTEAAKILIYPRLLKEQPVEFIRTKSSWVVQQGSIVSQPQKGSVENIFNEMLSLHPQSLAAMSKLKWSEFELTDSLATRVKILSGANKTLADVMIGKFSYKQSQNPYGGGNGVEGTTYLRLYDEKEIYAINGFLSFFFSGKFNDWRDKTFIRLNKDDITGVSFSYQADSSFKLFRSGNKWNIGIQPVDSAKTINFLTSLISMDGQDIKDNYKPAVNPVCQMQIEGNNLLNITVKCYQGDNPDEYILNSTLNPDVYYSSKKDGQFAKIFKGKDDFMADKRK
jgi:hypothetical protein